MQSPHLRKTSTAFFIFLAALMGSCTEAVTFTVRAGNHYADRALVRRLHFNDTLRFSYKLNEAAAYRYESIPNGYNKIFGISDSFDPHRTSCRLVFIHDRDGLKAGYYIYDDGKAPMQHQDLWGVLDTIEPNAWYRVMIIRGESSFIISHGLMDKKTQPNAREIPVTQGKPKWFFLVHPYVGGNYTLDEDLIIHLRFN